VFEIVLFGFKRPVDRIHQPSIGRPGEGGNVFIDVLERLVELLRLRSRHA
jgi:hypothetical protein